MRKETTHPWIPAYAKMTDQNAEPSVEFPTGSSINPPSTQTTCASSS
jgi:hypothetical protein